MRSNRFHAPRLDILSTRYASQLDSSLGSNILTSTSALGKHVMRDGAGILETLSIYVSPYLLTPSFVDYKRRHLPFKNCGTKNSNGFTNYSPPPVLLTAPRGRSDFRTTAHLKKRHVLQKGEYSFPWVREPIQTTTHRYIPEPVKTPRTSIRIPETSSWPRTRAPVPVWPHHPAPPDAPAAALALLQIRRLQPTTGLLVPKLPFQRLVRHLHRSF